MTEKTGGVSQAAFLISDIRREDYLGKAISFILFMLININDMRKILILTIVILSSCNVNYRTPWYNSVLEVDYEMPNPQIDRSQPYEKILRDLIVQKNNISKIHYVKVEGFMRITGIDSEIRVFFINPWNDDDVNKIADVVMKTLQFQPTWNDSDGGYSWRAGTYSVTLVERYLFGGDMALVISIKN